jgi:ADP-ribose pyrophosphatase YjhB (NUDIX family)
VPPGDDRIRDCCPACGRIHYHNPRVVVGCVPERGGRVLMCRRAIEPAHGAWTLPAGYLENGESVAEAAGRETLEETGSRVEVGDLFTVLSLIQVHQVYMMFRARLLDDDFGPTAESLEVRLFDEADVPWERIAFSSIRETLRLFFQDRAAGGFRLHQAVIEAGRLKP